MPIELLSFDNEPRVTAAVAIENSIWDWCPTTNASFRFAFESWPNDRYLEVYLLMDGETVRARAMVMETFWLETPGQAQMGVGSLNSDPAAYREMTLFGLKTLRERGFSRFILSAPSKSAGLCRTLEEIGFELTMRNKVSRLDLTTADLTANPTEDIEIISFGEYEARSPETFRKDLWRLTEEILMDVPMPEPFIGEPFEDWEQEYFRPDRQWGARVVALKDGKLIGLSELDPNKVDPALALTGLTGVLRPYRRQGIARQLKIDSLRRGKEMGMREVYTDNEENNPMYRLNEELGFRYGWDICVYTMAD